MFVFSIVPMAGNTVTLAVLLKAKPEKAALAVLLSNLLSIVYVPVMLALYAYASSLF
jgi:predicted permease